MAHFNFLIISIIAICLVGETFGVTYETNGKGNSNTNSRHFFRGHQVPSLQQDPLENELHELRDFTVTSTDESMSHTVTRSPDIEQALVGPLEQQLADAHRDVSDNPQPSTETAFTAEPIGESNVEVEDEGEETSTPTSVSLEGNMSTSLPPRRSLPYALRTFNTTKKRNNLNLEINKEDDITTTEGNSSEERLLELMVKLAAHPAQWERVHHELEHLDRELVASRRAVQMIQKPFRTNSETTSSQPRLPDALILENEADRVFDTVTSSQTPSLDRPPQQQPHGHHGNHNKQWPQFAYHRVTASPISNSPAEALPPGRHRNAFVAVSAVTPAQHRPRQQEHAPPRHVHRPSSSTELPDAMDELLARTPPREPANPAVDNERIQNSAEVSEEDAEEREIERLVQRLQSSAHHGPWTHERHRDQMKEQLRALEALHAQIEAKWQAQERVRSIRKDNHNSGQ